MLVRLGAGEIFGEISFLDTGDAGAGASVVAEDEVQRALLQPSCCRFCVDAVFVLQLPNCG